MTESIIHDFAALGAALKKLKEAKSQATADVPEPDAVSAVEQQLRENQNWADVYGAGLRQWIIWRIPPRSQHSG